MPMQVATIAKTSKRRRQISLYTAWSVTMANTAPLVRLAEHLLQSNGSISGQKVAEAVLPFVPNLLAAIPNGVSPALSSIDGRTSLDHNAIRRCVEETGNALHRLGFGRGSRVALVLPNGPELALAILAVTTWCSCVPLNAFGAACELELDLKQAAIDLVVGLDDQPVDSTSVGSNMIGANNIRELALKCGIPFCGLGPDMQMAGLYTLLPERIQPRTPLSTRALSEADRSAGDFRHESKEDHPLGCYEPNQHHDEILVLFTSGTTGGKKIVPHLLADVLVATSCISISWKLSPSDTNCNLMPLFHIGGIIRQVFSPILSGGEVICCPSFDPSLFWQILGQQGFTWYYAAPTMHQLILATGRAEGHLTAVGSTSSPLPVPKLRMIANAAGGLLPSLARELRQAFHAHILPSYGMTECMPITSPPASYLLEKPGTSGVAVGPEVAILDIGRMQPMPACKEGPICVRGAPCFRGYGILMGDTAAREKSFLPGGWFNTGDLGYMDADGYLYITGRSKEVINRGGEIISPLEVEEAVNAHPNVETCVAFSTQHSVLQEVVGIVLVTVPYRPKIDLPALHAFLGEGRLAAPKWPQCIVYMSAVPKSHTNKLLRVRLGQRLSLPELNDSMYPIERTFQAECPPIGTPVSVAIPCQQVTVVPGRIQDILREHLVKQADEELFVVPHPSKIGALVVHVYNLDRLSVVQCAREALDNFAVPSHVVLLRERDQELSPPQPSDALGSIILEEKNRGQGPTDPLVIELQDIFQELLDLDCLPAPDSNFFNLGGSSMLASQLASKVRKIYRVNFGGAEVFHHSTCGAIAKVIRERQRPATEHSSDSSGSISDQSASMAVSSLFSKNLNLPRKPFDPSRMDLTSGFFATLFQLIPLCIVYPVWQLTRFFLFFRVLLLMMVKVPGVHSLIVFVATLVAYHFLWVVITPLLFVIAKWVVIGKYRKGRYPLWGEYYLRWWFMDVLRKLIGRGLWGSNETMLNTYYRMLGAKIGKKARISLQADVAEYDLVSVGDGAAVEYATVRAFGVDNGCMILGPVAVGNCASVGARSVVAPYTSIPDNTHLGPVTSSYELYSAEVEPGDNSKHARYNRSALPEPSQLSKYMIAHPIMFAIDSLSHVPALLVLYWMVSMPWRHGKPFDSINDLMAWLCDPRRIPFYIGIRVARAVLAPLVYMFFAILVKWTIIGKFKPGPRDVTSNWQLIRHYLAARLFCRENMQECTELLGRHYELVSWLYRLLGAKVGKRVFWPGHQPIFSGEFDLLEVGDDVVFGSRSAIFCTTQDSCEKVILCAGANVSDNTVVLPGAIIGKNAVLGSNSLCPAGRYLPESSVCFGSLGGEPVMLEKGNEETEGPFQSNDVYDEKLEMVGDGSTLRPFGRAFYKRQATYWVIPLPFIILYTVLTKVFCASLHTFPLLGALHLTAIYLYGTPILGRAYQRSDLSFTGVYLLMLSTFFVAHFLRVVVWVLVELAAKWGFMGKREEGRYNWDTSSYGQNWELYQIMTKVRNFGRMNFLDFIAGTPYMASFFRWHGCKIGRDCCLYPAGGDPYMPEPDLVEMGDRCIIDCASVVCHLNTRGNFELAKIKMANNVTLRTRSRIQQGVQMESGSMLLEKSLAMTGEVIESDCIWQGAPASRVFSYDTSSIGSRATEAGSYPYAGTFV